MCSLRVLVILGILAASCIAEEFRVVTWNIQWFPGMRPGATAEAIQNQTEAVQQAIADLKPDILVMQEIQNWEAAQATIAADPSLKVQVVSRFQGSQQQVIASRFPVDSSWAARWEKTGENDPPRGYAFAVVRLPGDRLAFVYTFHFKANSSGD